MSDNIVDQGVFIFAQFSRGGGVRDEGEGGESNDHVFYVHTAVHAFGQKRNNNIYIPF